MDTPARGHGQSLRFRRLYRNGGLENTASPQFSGLRPRVVTSSSAISSPTEGTTVNRGVVTVSGTAASDAPDTQVRSVQLLVSGPGYAPAAVTTTGTSA